MPLVFDGFRVDDRLLDALVHGRICSIRHAESALRAICHQPRRPTVMGRGAMLWQPLCEFKAGGSVVLEVIEGYCVTRFHENPDAGIRIHGFKGAAKILLPGRILHGEVSGVSVMTLPPGLIYQKEVQSLFVGILHLPSRVRVEQ